MLPVAKIVLKLRKYPIFYILFEVKKKNKKLSIIIFKQNMYNNNILLYILL